MVRPLVKFIKALTEEKANEEQWQQIYSELKNKQDIVISDSIAFVAVSKAQWLLSTKSRLLPKASQSLAKTVEENLKSLIGENTLSEIVKGNVQRQQKEETRNFYENAVNAFIPGASENPEVQNVISGLLNN